MSTCSLARHAQTDECRPRICRCVQRGVQTPGAARLNVSAGAEDDASVGEILGTCHNRPLTVNLIVARLHSPWLHCLHLGNQVLFHHHNWLGPVCCLWAHPIQSVRVAFHRRTAIIKLMAVTIFLSPNAALRNADVHVAYLLHFRQRQHRSDKLRPRPVIIEHRPIHVCDASALAYLLLCVLHVLSALTAYEQTIHFHSGHQQRYELSVITRHRANNN